MQKIKSHFIDFLLEQQALKFGEFTLKSGRKSPYFFNLGMFNHGASLAKLGEFYAQAIKASQLEFDILFGPAYKGIPLVSTTSIALYQQHGQDIPYAFNRKEAKDHGESGLLVGAPVSGKVLMLDDVITAGTTVRETIEMMQPLPAKLSGIMIAFDRQEKGLGDQSAVQETYAKHGIPIYSIINLDDVAEYLSDRQNMQQHLQKISLYREKYGV